MRSSSRTPKPVAPFGTEAQVLGGPGGAGDVEMRPGQARRLARLAAALPAAAAVLRARRILPADEALEELRRGDGASRTPAHILHVGDVGLDLLVIGLAERHPPARLARALAGGHDARRQLVVIAEQPRMLVAERDDDGAGQRREVDHRHRLEPLLAVGHDVGQHQPPLGIGVDHLHRLARKRLHHVARPLRVAGRHVLHHADQPHRVHLGPPPGERRHQPDHRRAAGHVELHVLHAARRLDGDAAGVEGHALADEGDRPLRVLRLLAVAARRPTRRATASPPCAAR